jgi:hypothetical protein
VRRSLKKTKSELEDAVKEYGSARKAARALGISSSTFYDRISGHTSDEDDLVYPSLPSSELDAEEIIDHACKEFTRYKTATDARRWFEIKLKTNKPVGVCFMGDPHVDNPGCNWPLLREHVAILANTPGMYAIGGNDVADNWVGRLIRLYADQKMSRKQSLKIVKWLLKDAGVTWLCHILGNHDQWGDGPYLFKATAEHWVPVEDWQARFQIVFPNGKRVKIHMAHNFPGHSMWNNLHGAQRMAMWGEEADIFACAHTHTWALATGENPHRGTIHHLLRARGYKFIDQYSENRGYGSQKFGASITAVIDPNADGPSRIHCFADLTEAAELLTLKRGRT